MVQTRVQHSHWGRKRRRSQTIWKVHRMPLGHSAAAQGEQAGKGWSWLLIYCMCRLHLLWNFREIYCQVLPQILQVGSLPKEDQLSRVTCVTLKNPRVGAHNVQFQLDLTNCDWGSLGFPAILLSLSQSSAERTNWMDLLGPLPAVSWDIFVFCKGKTQADFFITASTGKICIKNNVGKKKKTWHLKRFLLILAGWSVHSLPDKNNSLLRVF